MVTIQGGNVEISEERLKQLLEDAASKAVAQVTTRPILQKLLRAKGAVVQMRKSNFILIALRMLGVDANNVNLSELAREAMEAAYEEVSKNGLPLSADDLEGNPRLNFRLDREVLAKINSSGIAKDDLFILGLIQLIQKEDVRALKFDESKLTKP